MRKYQRTLAYLIGVSGAALGQAVNAQSVDPAAVVAVFSQGAEGDQRPLLMLPQDNLQRARTHQPLISLAIGGPPPWESQMGARNAVLDAMKSYSTPMSAGEREAFEKNLSAASAGVDAMGWIIGEAAMEAVQAGRASPPEERFIGGKAETVSCPGRIRNDATNPVRQNADPEYSDAPPINLEVGALRIGDVVLFRVDGELYSEIGSRLKSESPVPKTVVVGLANGFGNSGYIYSNNASHQKTFEVIDSRLKPGCAEDKIVEAATRMGYSLNRSGGTR